MAFFSSQFVRNEKVFYMVDIQNATLAGGVAMGTAANMVHHPAIAILIGSLSGFVSVFGFAVVQPWIEEKFGIHDTCGVNNLHGMPSIIGAVAGVIISRLADSDLYNEEELLLVFPQRGDRSTTAQAGYQVAFIAITLGIAIFSGLVVGVLVAKASRLKKYFVDSELWEVPNMELPYYFDKRGEINREAHEVPSEAKMETQIKQLLSKVKDLETKQGMQGITTPKVSNVNNNNNNNGTTNIAVLTLLENLTEKVNLLVKEKSN